MPILLTDEERRMCLQAADNALMEAARISAEALARHLTARKRESEANQGDSHVTT